MTRLKVEGVDKCGEGVEKGWARIVDINDTDWLIVSMLELPKMMLATVESGHVIIQYTKLLRME